MLENQNVRVRFAPSPTGSLHIGGVRTALYNYLIARKTGGKFIIRIEDTDQARFVPGAEAYIFNCLSWLGLEADESPLKGGQHAPYRQSERLQYYRDHIEMLLKSGNAYIAFDSAAALEQARASQPEGTWQYNSATRLQMENSLSLGEEETRKRMAEGYPYVVRLKVPKNEEIRFEDLIRGWVMVHSSTLDDKVLMKSDGMPTYHLANVVDDHLMEISHVIRGEEWLPSAPTHVLLYRAFGWENTMPRFAHLPLLLKPAGDGKLSKRDGEVFGFPVFPISWKDDSSGKEIPGFRENGYLPEALLNFLALLGWNPGTEQEIFSLEELIKAFSVERIGKSGTRFDIQKANWFNHHYLQKKPFSYFREGITSLTRNPLSEENLQLWVQLVRERCNFEHEMLAIIGSLLNFNGEAEEQILREKWNADAASGLQAFYNSMQEIPIWQADEIKKSFSEITEQAGFKPGKLFLPLRIAMTGAAAGPDLMLFMQILGKEACAGRLAAALQKFGKII